MKRGGGVSGAVSLVMIFCVLCLAVFAVLTLATADRERNRAQLTAQSAEAYYEADRQATEVLAAMQMDGPIPADVAVNRVTSAAPEGSEETVSFTIPIGEEQGLEVEALLRGGDVEVLRWQTAYTGGWETDDTLDLWSGDIY